jgi:hypothetical protein
MLYLIKFAISHLPSRGPPKPKWVSRIGLKFKYLGNLLKLRRPNIENHDSLKDPAGFCQQFFPEGF